MLITESFVMLNYPKTGSSFAREVIKDLYADVPCRWFRKRFCKELILPNIRHGAGVPDQHGTYSQIPPRYRNREIVSIVRNPYERFLSIFEFRYWVHNPLQPVDVIRARFPTFPNLTLDEYVDFDEYRFQRINRVPVGPQTVQFMQIFGRRFPPLMLGPYDLRSVLRYLAKVTFLRQENLNQELRQFLHRHGFSDEQTAFIESHARVNVTAEKSADRTSVWTPKALNYVRTAEALLFEILRENGICYESPRSQAA
jgi:hypothetical protein